MPEDRLHTSLPWEAVPTDSTAVVLVRHGRTAWNHTRRFLGQTDVPLDAEGLRAASELGPVLRGRFAAVYSSPLSRAMQTAACFATEIGVVPGLMELDQGEVEGMKAAEALEAFPAFFEAWAVDPTHARVPGGESLGEVQERALAALRALLVAHPGERFAVVTHQLVIAALSCAAAGESLRSYSRFTVPNLGLTVLTLERGELRLAATGHTV